MTPSSSPPADAPPHAGVRFPPPLLYVIGLVLAWALQRWISWPITAGPSRARVAIAGLFVLAYLAFFVGALTVFRRARTTLIPNRPATAFVTTGPYRWTRNPMYVSMVFLYLAAAMFLNTWWTLVLLVVVVLAIDRLVIAREERYLSAAFPAEYAEYRSRVRRWI
jgi:protein-S-isoprenylcysteine O-methyltransferase Ste14